MANVLKYKTSQPTKRALRKGNVVLGIGEENYGPSSTTGYYNGIDVPEGGYVVYTLGANNNPKAFVAETEDDLRAIARTLGGGKLDIMGAKNYLHTLSNTWMVDSMPKNLVTDGLVLHLNAKNQTSFLDNEPTTNNINGGATRAEGISDIWYRGSHAGNSTVVVVNEFYSVERPHIIRAYSTNTTGYYMFNQKSAIQNQSGSRYSYSFDYKQLSGNTFTPTMNVYGDGYKQPNSSNYYANISYQYIPLADGWTRFVGTYDATYTGYNTYRINMQTNDSVDYEILFDNFQTEEGEGTNFTTGSRSQNTTIYDLSGNGNNGTLQNGVSFDSNGAIEFDGVNDYIITSPNIFSSITSNLTMECTFQRNSGRTIINYGTAGNGAYKYFNLESLSSNLVTVLATFNNNVVLTGTTTISTNTWYQGVVTYNGNTVNLYVNGELENSTSATGNIRYAGDPSLNIGRKNEGNGEYISGKVNSAKIYNRALSASEIKQNYYGGPIVTDGLVYAMDAGNLVSYENGSTTAYSMTGSITGTLNNGVGYNSYNSGVWSFDGSDDRINSSSPLSAGASTYTIEAIFKADSTKTQVIWEQNSSGVTQHQRACMILLSNGYGGFNGQSNDYHSVVPYSTGVWYHWIITVDKNASSNPIKIYVNGSLYSQGNPSAGASNLNVGTHGAAVGYKLNANSEYFDGDIGVVRVYNKTLTPSEVLQNFNAQKARFGL